MLAMNSNRKLVQSKMMEESGNVVLSKDLSNISAKSSQGSTRNNLETVVQTLRGWVSEVITNACSLHYFV